MEIDKSLKKCFMSIDPADGSVSLHDSANEALEEANIGDFLFEAELKCLGRFKIQLSTNLEGT